MEFRAGPAKPAVTCQLTQLRRETTKKNHPTKAKDVGNSVKVYMSGDTNYYVPDTPNLRRFLRQRYGIEVY